MQEARKFPGIRLAILLVAGLVSGCGAAASGSAPRIVQPGAPGDASRVRTIEQVAAQDLPTHSGADVEFMQGMIGHHQQALEMTALVEDRTESREIALLSRRIELTQLDEIDLMGRWLDRRGEPIAGAPMHAGMPGGSMPYGMLSPDEMARLASASGDDFERLFLEYMIRHHEGAVRMVEELFASPEGGQESEVFKFASGVAADQPIEIARMRQMLAERR